MIKVQIKKLDPKAKIPEYKTEGASGVDIMALLDNKITLDPGESKIIPTGLSIACSRRSRDSNKAKIRVGS